MTTSIRVSFLAVFAAVIGFSFFVSPAEASHSWGDYHWARTSNPFTIKLGDNLNTAAWDASLALASSDWTLSILDTTIVPGLTNATKGRNTVKNCLPTSGRVEVCNASYGGTGWLGIASIWINGNHITQGTVKLNDTYFNTAPYNTSAWRNLVTCQEVGHTFGLAHQDENFSNANLNTCMDYTSNPESNQHPNQHDYDQLVTIYSQHLDTFTTASSVLSKPGASGAQRDEDFTDASEWGREIYHSADGRSSVFERDLGNGNKLLTHVFWVEGRGNH
jgi:hypothetical protein